MLCTLSLSYDIQFTNCTTREPLFHDPYESHETNGSWNDIYTLSLSNDIQFTNCSTRKTLFNDLYDSYKSFEKEHTLIRVVSVRVYWTTLCFSYHRQYFQILKNYTKTNTATNKETQSLAFLFSSIQPDTIFSHFVNLLSFWLKR